MLIKKVNETEKIYINPKIKIIRDVFNITNVHDYIQYQEILFQHDASIYLNPCGKNLAVLSDNLSKINIHIYSLPDMNLISESTQLYDDISTAGNILHYEINWIDDDKYELIKVNSIPTIHAPIYKHAYIKLLEYIHFSIYQSHISTNTYFNRKKDEMSFMEFYCILHNQYNSKYKNIHETAIPIGQCPKYKYVIHGCLLNIFMRKDYFITDNYEYINKAINLDENTHIPIELCEIIASYMLPETIIDIVNKLK